MWRELISGENTTMMLPTIRLSSAVVSAAILCTDDFGTRNIQIKIETTEAATTTAARTPVGVRVGPVCANGLTAAQPHAARARSARGDARQAPPSPRPKPNQENSRRAVRERLPARERWRLRASSRRRVPYEPQSRAARARGAPLIACLQIGDVLVHKFQFTGIAKDLHLALAPIVRLRTKQRQCAVTPVEEV